MPKQLYIFMQHFGHYIFQSVFRVGSVTSGGHLWRKLSLNIWVYQSAFCQGIQNLYFIIKQSHLNVNFESLYGVFEARNASTYQVFPWEIIWTLWHYLKLILN